MSIDQAKCMLEFTPALAVWQPKLMVRGQWLSEERVWGLIRRLAGFAIAQQDGCVVWGGSKTPDGYARFKISIDGITTP